ncbi:MAG: ABC transporter substrate-binding protein [Novosphingobium sp.]|nr:ABC transporter substrate-binding protein [Novosphingobium sp.]MCP5402480.1 ABC transporter substrate-binding protein [Novosphingobium sp.]
MAEKIRVGVLNDMADRPPAQGDVTGELKREVDAVRAEERLEPEVEFVHAYGLGLPQGKSEAVVRAYEELAAKDVLMIVGPAIGDNALIATPLAERHKIATINWAGAERARGEYMFHLQVGSHEDESLVIARHLKAIGANRLGVVYDMSPIGTRHLKYLEDEARIIGQEIVRSEPISPLCEDAGAEVDAVLAEKPEGFVYLGLGLSAPAVANPLAARGWKGPRIMNTAGLRGYQEDFARSIDGWIYIDMHSDGNRTLTALRERLKAPPRQAVWVAKGYDLGRLVAEGLARSTEFTREGVKTGLEQIKWLPAAEGEEGTLLGFGIQDRGALHGRYLVLRQWIDGSTVEVRAP